MSFGQLECGEMVHYPSESLKDLGCPLPHLLKCNDLGY
jgi:hypothetical protein